MDGSFSAAPDEGDFTQLGVPQQGEGSPPREPDTNIPSLHHGNTFTCDPIAEALWSHLIEGERYDELRGHFVRFGEHGARSLPLAIRADQHPPTLETYDEAGDRVDRVVYHPDYRELEALAYGSGLVALKYDPEILARHSDHRHLFAFGLGYYFTQNEGGLYCPVCMTDGVARVLERHGEGEIARETLLRLVTTDMAALWQGAMFLTERQGGSDVGANAVEARRDGDRWLLTGHKWFCSNVDAEAVLVLARMPNGRTGTAGLGLFLLLRHRPDGNSRHIRIERLKDKLGTRSMATGEVTLDGAEAYLIGGEGEGFRLMTEMLNLSRTYNAVASVASMRRAIVEALAYGDQRRAFGRRLWDLPLWRATMADLVAEQLASLLTVIELTRALDDADAGNDGARKLVRILTPLCKSMTAKQAVATASECMEAVGGNAYVGGSPLPRILRDAQVLPIWEGTTNILALDAFRAVARELSHQALFARIGRALDVGGPIDPRRAGLVVSRCEDVAERLQRLAGVSAEDRERAAKGWIESAWRATQLALLLEHSAVESLRAPCLAAFDRLVARPSPTAPYGACDADGLADTEEVLLRAAFTPVAGSG